ncbi:MAG TPA: tRNA preQ1(34) S-adenosylmethionine ribosyltransferase-isomerase QueA [Acidimicrobiia bacterium]|nr:tRNA preQ1(34) S-adenosylmethionine ribosyltransferase-isomerase QueA [Acidimicrobiia bacterium]
MLASEFEYDLPEERIAQVPVEPRHDARLLDTRTFTDRHFRDLPDLLEAGDLVVVNRTRVQPARLLGHKADTGGRVEALLLRRLSDGTWESMMRPARRLRAGSVLDFAGTPAKVEKIADGLAVIRVDAEAAMARAGEVPLPPYIRRKLTDPERYQTVFGREQGSAASPTAALHFTPGVLAALTARGVDVAEVILHIGLDTFRPISAELIEDHLIHTEEFQVPDETARAVRACRKRRGRVIAIGTTVVRTIETVADDSGLITAGGGTTSLFITPGYRFRVVDGLVTNFHLPRTTLLVLLGAFMGESWRQTYELALERDYRFASFGDAMYAERSA